jgi:putative PIN family toxin of toxin-antitoxin system
VLRVTADTNIFISGLNFRGKPFELLTLARAGKIELAMSDAIMTEIKRVLSLKFKWPDEDIVAVERQIKSFTRHVDPQQPVDLVKEDPTDNRILECAADAHSDFIVTGDNHLLKFGQFGNTPIVNVASFFEIQSPSGHSR